MKGFLTDMVCRIPPARGRANPYLNTPRAQKVRRGGDSHRDGGVFLDFQVISRVALWDGRREAVRHVSDTA